MGHSLPEADLYYLPRDNLDPEKFALIMTPSCAWSHIDEESVFNDAAFSFDGAQRVIDAYKHSVARRDYSRTGGKPFPTILRALSDADIAGAAAVIRQLDLK